MIKIAIDGPSGAGKSSLSRKAAEALGFLYIDTGALYRAIGLAAIRSGIATDDSPAIAALTSSISVTLQPTPDGQQVFLNGENVTGLIRTEQVSTYASAVSAVPEIRAFLLDTQRRLAAEQNVIMDGRDIGTVVLPDAQLKIFLTASPEARARRRLDELQARGEAADFETVYRDLVARDQRDTERAVAPLVQSPDAVRLDTTDNSFEQSLELLLKLIKERI